MKQQTLLLVRICVLFCCALAFPFVLPAQIITVGPANGQNTSTTYPTPYGGYHETMRAQYLYKAGELTGAGAKEGYISGVTFTVLNDNGVGILENYKIRLSNSLADSLPAGGWEPAGTLVYDTLMFQPINGNNPHFLQTLFHWDGTSNLLVEICHTFSNLAGTNETFNASVASTVNLGFSCSRTFAENDYTFVCGTSDSLEVGDRHSRPVLLLKFACIPPTAINLISTTSSTATLNWTVPTGNNGAQYTLEVGYKGFTPGTNQAIYTTNTPATQVTVTALIPSKSYQAYVRVKCGNDNTIWVGPVDFTLPPGCGDFFYDPGGDTSEYKNNLLVSSTICPSDSVSVVSLGFSDFKVADGDTLRIYNGLDTQAPLLGEFTGNTIPGPFTATNISGCLTAVFKSDSTITGPGWAAKVLCALPDSCFTPAGLTLSNLTYKKAQFDWIPTFGAQSYKWELTDVNDNILANGDTTGTSLKFDSLSEATFYKFYIKTICTSGDSTSWVLINFNTPLNCNTAPAINCGNGTSGHVISSGTGIYKLHSCGSDSTLGREHIFTYYAPNTRKYTFHVTVASTSNVYVAYFYKDAALGCGPGDWKCLGVFNKPDTMVFGTLTAGHTYFILFDPITTDSVYQVFKITDCKPTNDDPWTAIPLTLGTGCDNSTYSNDGATFKGSLGEPNPDTASSDGYAGRWLSPANRTVWFRFTAPPSGTVTIATDNYPSGKFKDTQIALYEVGDPNDYATFILLESDEDKGINNTDTVGLNATVSFTDLTPGLDYYIQVDGFGSGQDAFCVQVFDGAPRTLVSACSDQGTTAYYRAPVASDHWYGIYSNPDIFDLGQLAAAVKPGSQAFDTVFCQVNIYPNIPIATNGIPYMPAYYNFQFKPAAAQPVRVRIYFYNNEFDDLKTYAGQPAATIQDLNISYYNGINQDCEQNNNIDAAGDTLLITDVVAQQMDGTFYLEFNLPGAGEVAAHLGSLALPLELKSFYGVVQNKSNMLEWVTLSEKDVKWHIVERSADGTNWSETGRKPGKALSSTAQQYQLEDLQPLPKAYYRLRMVDENGQETYSGSVYLVRREQFGINRIFPNPVTDQVTVQYTADSEEDIQIRVVDCMGRFVLEQSLTPYKGFNAAHLSFGSLAAGLYTVTIASGTAVSDPVRVMVDH